MRLITSSWAEYFCFQTMKLCEILSINGLIFPACKFLKIYQQAIVLVPRVWWLVSYTVSAIVPTMFARSLNVNRYLDILHLDTYQGLLKSRQVRCSSVPCFGDSTGVEHFHYFKAIHGPPIRIIVKCVKMPTSGWRFRRFDCSLQNQRHLAWWRQFNGLILPYCRWLSSMEL